MKTYLWVFGLIFLSSCAAVANVGAQKAKSVFNSCLAEGGEKEVIYLKGSIGPSTVGMRLERSDNAVEGAYFENDKLWIQNTFGKITESGDIVLDVLSPTTSIGTLRLNRAQQVKDECKLLGNLTTDKNSDSVPVVLSLNPYETPVLKEHRTQQNITKEEASSHCLAFSIEGEDVLRPCIVSKFEKIGTLFGRDIFVASYVPHPKSLHRTSGIQGFSFDGYGVFDSPVKKDGSLRNVFTERVSDVGLYVGKPFISKHKSKKVILFPKGSGRIQENYYLEWSGSDWKLISN